jgi:hypothetical protein
MFKYYVRLSWKDVHTESLIIVTAITNFIQNNCHLCKGKGKVKVVPVFNEAPLHEEGLREWRYSSTHSLTSALDGGEWSASRPGRSIPRERASSTH